MYGTVPLMLPGRPPNYRGPLVKFTPPGEDVPDSVGVAKDQGPLVAVDCVTKPSVNNVAFYDFGDVSAATKLPITHDFVLRNASNAALAIDRVEGGCACTSATADLASLDPGHVLPPGKNLTIHVSVDTGQLYVGHINKLVFVYLKPSSQAAFLFHVIGDIIPTATFDPPLIDLGTIHPGARWPGRLIVDTDTRVYGQQPPAPMPLDNSLILKRDRGHAARHGAYLRRTYLVSVAKDAHLGALNTAIAIPLADGSGRPGPSAIAIGSITGNYR